jgi:hypothetical protein
MAVAVNDFSDFLVAFHPGDDFFQNPQAFFYTFTGRSHLQESLPLFHSESLGAGNNKGQSPQINTMKPSIVSHTPG